MAMPHSASEGDSHRQMKRDLSRLAVVTASKAILLATFGASLDSSGGTFPFFALWGIVLAVASSWMKILGAMRYFLTVDKRIPPPLETREHRRVRLAMLRQEECLLESCSQRVERRVSVVMTRRRMRLS